MVPLGKRVRKKRARNLKVEDKDDSEKANKIEERRDVEEETLNQINEAIEERSHIQFQASLESHDGKGSDSFECKFVGFFLDEFINFDLILDLDHTADVQIHSWGDSLEEALGACVVGMFNYMTDVGVVEEREEREMMVEGLFLSKLVKLTDRS